MLQRSIIATIKLESKVEKKEQSGIPLDDLPATVRKIHIKVHQAPQKLGLDKALYCMQSEFTNNTAKFNELNWHIEQDTKKLHKLEGVPR